MLGYKIQQPPNYFLPLFSFFSWSVSSSFSDVASRIGLLIFAYRNVTTTNALYRFRMILKFFIIHYFFFNIFFRPSFGLIPLCPLCQLAGQTWPCSWVKIMASSTRKISSTFRPTFHYINDSGSHYIILIYNKNSTQIYALLCIQRHIFAGNFFCNI